MERAKSESSVVVVEKEDVTAQIQNEVDYNQVLTHIGQFGKWQQNIFFWACAVALANGIVAVTFAFTAYVPKYRCSVPFCESYPNWTYFEGESTDGFPEFVKKGIPGSALTHNQECSYLGMSDLTADPIASSESCDFYLSEIERNASDIILVNCSPDQIIFDTDIMQSSIVTEYGLTCLKSDAKNVIGSVYMIGVMLGSICAGIYADRFGRLPTLMIGAVGTAISGVAGAFVETPEAFGFFRLTTGFSVSGLYLMAFIMTLEVVGSKFTAFLGIATSIAFAMGELILGLEAYFIRDWRTLQIVAHAPVFFLLLLWFLIPESPRWLIATGRTKEAELILAQGAKANKKSIPESLIKVPPKEEGPSNFIKNIQFAKTFVVDKCDFKKAATVGSVTISEKVTKEQKVTKKDKGNKSQQSESQRHSSFLELFRPKIVFHRTLILFLQWFTACFMYYGLAFGAASLSGDPHTNYSLSVLIEIPGYIFAMTIVDCWGRKSALSFCQILPGFASILAGLLVDNKGMAPLQIVLLLVAKFGASACFSIVYLYTAELYPTTLRASSLGACSLVARLGSILAVLVERTSIIWSPLPLVLMGAAAIVAGFSAFFLPETAGHGLPETKTEALEIGSKNKRGICTCLCSNSWNDFIPTN